uniref:Uncharacterized protein n=1 Tax=Glossina austeni TaxID=7395 RepID=A0A1A9VHI6_GLOAU
MNKGQGAIMIMIRDDENNTIVNMKACVQYRRSNGITLFVVTVVLVLRCATVDVLASKGLVSITPIIVSAGPTISSSSRERVTLPPELLLLLLPTLVQLVDIKVVDTEI